MPTAPPAAVGTGGLLLFAPLLMLLFRQKYPRWWFDWNLELQRFGNRVGAYLALMDDRYPAADDHQSVRLDYSYPDAPELNRWLPLVKWLLTIPHYIVLSFLDIGAFVAVVIAWFAILFTGSYPRGLFDFVEGVFRWHNRVIGHPVTLVTEWNDQIASHGCAGGCSRNTMARPGSTRATGRARPSFSPSHPFRTRRI